MPAFMKIAIAVLPNRCTTLTRNRGHFVDDGLVHAAQAEHRMVTVSTVGAVLRITSARLRNGIKAGHGI